MEKTPQMHLTSFWHFLFPKMNMCKEKKNKTFFCFCHIVLLIELFPWQIWSCVWSLMRQRIATQPALHKPISVSTNPPPHTTKPSNRRVMTTAPARIVKFHYKYKCVEILEMQNPFSNSGPGDLWSRSVYIKHASPNPIRHIMASYQTQLTPPEPTFL